MLPLQQYQWYQYACKSFKHNNAQMNMNGEPAVSKGWNHFKMCWGKHNISVGAAISGTMKEWTACRREESR